MRYFELSTAMPAPAGRVWTALIELEHWPAWNTLVPFASGDVRAGSVLAFKIRQAGGGLRDHKPVVVSLDPGRQIVLAASFHHRHIVHLVHTSTPDRQEPKLCRLHQSWKATGLLVPPCWNVLRAAMARFADLGDDLARRVA